MLKTEFGFFADWASALPLSESTTVQSPTSLVNPLAIWPFVSSSNFQVRFVSSPANRGAARNPSVTRLTAQLQLRHHRYVSVAEQTNLGIESQDNLPDVPGELSDAGRLRLAQSAARWRSTAGIDPSRSNRSIEIVGREPTRLQTAAERLQGTGIEPVPRARRERGPGPPRLALRPSRPRGHRGRRPRGRRYASARWPCHAGRRREATPARAGSRRGGHPSELVVSNVLYSSRPASSG